MRAVFLFFALSLSGVVAVADAIPQRLDRVKFVSDGICAIGKISFHEKDDSGGKDPLWMFRAIEEDSPEVAGGGFVRIDFTLKPEAGSFIRCRAEFPLPEKWNSHCRKWKKVWRQNCR